MTSRYAVWFQSQEWTELDYDIILIIIIIIIIIIFFKPTSTKPQAEKLG